VKGSVVLILIALSLAVSVALQSSKTGSTDDSNIGRISNGIAGMRAFIPQGSNISYRGEPANYASYMQARYLLAPSAMNIAAENTNPDTLLAIQYIYSGDSTLNQYIAARRLVWQHTDDRYRYTLTIKN
jgi:hypothetical protein